MVPDRHGAELAAERQGGGAGVEDDAGGEVVAEAVGQSARPAEVVEVNGGGRLRHSAATIALQVSSLV